MKKCLSIVAALVMAMLLLVPAPARAEDVTLTWAVFETSCRTEAFYQHIIDAFERDNPGIRIERVLMTGNSRAEYLHAMLGAGTMPDINIEPADLAGIPGVYAEVPDWLLARFDPSEVVPYGGRHVLIPAYEGMRAQVFYNRDQFAAAGIDAPPDTPEAFADACEKLRAAGFTPLICSGPKTQWAVDFGIWTGMINSDLIAAYPDFNADLAGGSVKWRNEVLRRDLQYWRGLIDAGYYHPASMSLSYSQACMEFIMGHAAMMLDGAWLAATIDQSGDARASENIGCFPVPCFSGARTYCTLQQQWAVSGSCAHKDEAFRFCAYVLGGNPEIYRYYLQADGVYSVTLDPVTYPLGPLQQAFADNFKGYERVPEITGALGDDSLPARFGNRLHEAMQQVFTGTNIDILLNRLDRDYAQLSQP